MMTRVLGMIGLVRAARYVNVVAHLKKAEARAVTIARQLEDVRTESAGWKAKARDAQAAQKQVHAAQRQAKTAADEARRDAARQAAELQKVKADVERRTHQESARVVDTETLHVRLRDAERELTIAREHLMVIEVKLDILEGAANVLDGRTRSVLARRTATDRGGPVRPVAG